jgi:CMP-N-acetylneuraminic acid synthetase
LLFIKTTKIVTYKIIGCIYINNLNKISSTTVLNENETPFIIDNKYDVDIDTIEEQTK